MLRIPKAALRRLPLFLMSLVLCGQSQTGEIRLLVQDSAGLRDGSLGQARESRQQSESQL